MAKNPATSSFYGNYSPYLQPTPSLGSNARISGAVAVATRPQIGGIARIYAYYKTIGKGPEFINNLVFDIYGKRMS